MGLKDFAGQTLRQLIIESVRDITEMKRGDTEPCVARMEEIRNSINIEVTECLRGLCREKILAVSMDVNKRPMFKILNTVEL